MNDKINPEIVKKAIVSRPLDCSKGTFGSALEICGSCSMAGAAIMAGKGALRCGAGLLKIALPKSIYPIAASAIFESVFYPLEDSEDGNIDKSQTPFLLKRAGESSSVLIGCGMKNNSHTAFITRYFLERCQTPMVLDADALNSIAENTELLKQAKAPVILTPHPGEMARLARLTVKQVQQNREELARSFAREHDVYLVLKGAGTVVAAPEGKALVNTTGNPGMATGGSGDVLAGMMSSLLAQNPKMPFECACAAVYLHGLAGDIAREKYGEISMLPTDLIDCIPLAIKNFISGRQNL